MLTIRRALSESVVKPDPEQSSGMISFNLARAHPIREPERPYIQERQKEAIANRKSK